MKILAIDTAFNSCSVAFYDTDNGVTHTFSEELERGHAERLMPMVGTVLSMASCRYMDIDLFAVATGPGAFTGMRVGIATAKALSLSLAKPLVGVDSFSSFYHQTCISSEADIKSSALFAVILETKREGYYFAILNKDGKQQGSSSYCYKEAICNAIEDKNCTLLGNGVERFLNETNLCNSKYSSIVRDINYPSPVAIAEIAQKIFETGNSDFSVSAIYLREADVTLPKKADRYLGIL